MSDDSSERIARHLRSVAHAAAPGDRLPSTRELAARFGAGPVTVQRALARLVAEGIVETRSGTGTFVRERLRPQWSSDVSWQTAALGPERSSTPMVGSTMRVAGAGTIAMSSGYPDPELLLTREVRAAFARAARRDDLARPPTAGLPALRRWFADELGDGRRESDVLIASGGQAALAATFRALARPGDAIVMESPTYWGAIAAARQAGLVIVPVPRTDGAPRAADLDAAFATSGARLAYVQPVFANPTGDVWTADQRAEVLDVARSHRAFLVEDDWARDFALDDRPPPPLAVDDPDGHVVYIRSLTKSLSVTVRVAALSARGPARARIESALTVSDLYVAPILQTVALDVVTRPAWQTHLPRLQRELRTRRDALRTVLSAHLPESVVATPRGGLNLWLALPEFGSTGTPTDGALVAARTLAAGLSISPGPEWFPAEPTGPYVRLNFAVEPTSRYDEAAGILAAAL